MSISSTIRPCPTANPPPCCCSPRSIWTTHRFANPLMSVGMPSSTSQLRIVFNSPRIGATFYRLPFPLRWEGVGGGGLLLVPTHKVSAVLPRRRREHQGKHLRARNRRLRLNPEHLHRA